LSDYNVQISCPSSKTSEVYKNSWEYLQLMNVIKVVFLTQYDTDDSTTVLTGSADNSIKLWECETGSELHHLKTETAVRTCGFSSPRKVFFYSTDEQMGMKCSIYLYDVVSLEKINFVTAEKSKVTAASWGPFDDYLLTGHENGMIGQYDLRVSY